MSYDLHETIVARATAPGGGARAVVRLAGPATGSCLARCFQPDGGACLESVGQATVLSGQFTLTVRQSPFPCRVYFWPGRQSYTRSPLAEVHLFGSPPLADAAIRTLCSHGARLARPGEFTLRAFLSGRIDLTQAEAILGVIDATGQSEMDVALRQLAGGVSVPLTRLRDDLLGLLAELEAGLDFVEEDIEFIGRGALLGRLAKAEDQVSDLATQMESRSESVHAVRAVLTGSPNVGKSSLFNALTNESGAIVSEVPGTTRDYLTARIELNGVGCELIDTAGVHELRSPDPVAVAARTAATQQHDQASIHILCVDASCELDDQQLDRPDAEGGQPSLVVLTKCDVPEAPVPSAATLFGTNDAVAVSSRTGRGLDELRARLRRLIMASQTNEGDFVASTALRCRESLRQAASYLRKARNAASSMIGDEIVAAEVRSALDELGQVVGAVYTDDILDRIFSRFCIGK
jgi:tRNA modification GTPase